MTATTQFGNVVDDGGGICVGERGYVRSKRVMVGGNGRGRKKCDWQISLRFVSTCSHALTTNKPYRSRASGFSAGQPMIPRRRSRSKLRYFLRPLFFGALYALFCRRISVVCVMSMHKSSGGQPPKNVIPHCIGIRQQPHIKYRSQISVLVVHLSAEKA